jgi:hypothetical protein
VAVPAGPGQGMEDIQQEQQEQARREEHRRIVVSLKSPLTSSSAFPPGSSSAAASAASTNATVRPSGPSGAGSPFGSRSLSSGATWKNPFFVDDPIFEHIQQPSASAPAGPVRSSAPGPSSHRKDRATRRSADVLLHVRAIDDGEGGWC